MLGSSGLLSGIRTSFLRSIDSKVATARVRASAASKKQNPVPIQRDAKSTPKRLIELKYPLQELPKSTMPSGWLLPLGGTEKLPFQFVRTESHQLPVYSDIKNGRTRRVTVLRKYVGDVKELKEELHRLLGADAKIEEHLGELQITGHHVLKLKRWLRRLGF